jgi:hypothetical protein
MIKYIQECEACSFLYNAMFKFSLAILAVFVITVAYWQFLDGPPNTIGGNYEIKNSDTIYPGGNLELRVYGNNVYEIKTNSSIRTIKNKFTFVLADQSNAVAGPFDRTVLIPIPPWAIEGDHSYNYCADLIINPIKTRFVCNKPLHFNVKKQPQ